MTPRDLSRTYLLVFGGIFFVMSALHVVRFLGQPRDIWWTPKALSVPLADASDRVEVYVRELPMLERLKADHVQLMTDAGLTPVKGSDVRLRFNNWDRVRVQGLPGLLVAAACAGASGAFLLFGILGWSPRRRPSASE